MSMENEFSNLICMNNIIPSHIKSQNTNQWLKESLMPVFHQDVNLNNDIKIINNGDVRYLSSCFNLKENICVLKSAITKLLIDGNTLVFNHLEKRTPVFWAMFTEALKKQSYLLHFNLYWSPPNAHGAGAHVDEHDVFIIQLIVEKNGFLKKSSWYLPPEIFYIFLKVPCMIL